MSARPPRVRTVLVMWEHACDYSPLWSRSEDLEIGPIDGTDIGLDPLLVEDLADWNRRLVAEGDADGSEAFPGTVARAAESFRLAAQVQRVLGDRWTVWCCAGSGDGDLRNARYRPFRDGQPLLLLRDDGVVDWSPAGATAAEGIEPATAGAIEEWRTAPLMPAERRVLGLELCALVQDERRDARVLWFGGEDVPT